ncbi:MAG TPA: ankyrin repeat domain-containing protein [Capsulimonadaceae bacterium]|nr:ankyrin repeat domain-containing protein [Capsulimonadaceae bacterium]
MHTSSQAQGPDLYDAVGGEPGCRRLAEAFYARIPKDPVLRAVYPASSHCAVDALGAIFIQLFGGPNAYSRQRFWLSLREAHARFRIGPIEREAWVRNMVAAVEDIDLAEPARTELAAFFERSSVYLVNHPETAPRAAEMPTGSERGSAMEGRWAAQQTLDEIVAAVRARKSERAIALAESASLKAYLRDDRAAYASLLAVMGGSGISELIAYVRETLVRQPDLLEERYWRGRTLLYSASASASEAFVEMLLGLGADPNAADECGHTPLYGAGNEQGTAGIVRLLANAGADVNAQDKIKRCTALHMAARRGNVPLAEALLNCGANIEVRDINGETPLRRAVNCGKPHMARLLIERGADPDSRGSKGLTARQAARSAAIQQLFAPLTSIKD